MLVGTSSREVVLSPLSRTFPLRFYIKPWLSKTSCFTLSAPTSNPKQYWRDAAVFSVKLSSHGELPKKSSRFFLSRGQRLLLPSCFGWFKKQSSQSEVRVLLLCVQASPSHRFRLRRQSSHTWPTKNENNTVQQHSETETLHPVRFDTCLWPQVHPAAIYVWLTPDKGEWWNRLLSLLLYELVRACTDINLFTWRILLNPLQFSRVSYSSWWEYKTTPICQLLQFSW